MGKVLANGPEDRGSIPKTQKMVLDGFLLNTLRLPLNFCVVAIEKGAFDYDRQLYFIYIHIQTVDETTCISRSANTLWKGMNPAILHPGMGR